MVLGTFYLKRKKNNSKAPFTLELAQLTNLLYVSRYSLMDRSYRDVRLGSYYESRGTPKM